jgi:RNA polymerase sigma-70 factor (ECF subfamily)
MSLAFKPAVSCMSSSESDQPEIEWMRRIREGDMEAFRLLVETHQSRIVGTISKMLGSDAEAEDLAQQVFIRVWRSAPRYQPTMRRKRHFVDQTDDLAEPAERKERGPDQVLLEEELQTAIQDAISKLPEAQRLAIVLRRYEELPYEEIAKVMGTTVPAVKSILFRARAELRERLAKYLE